MTTQPNPTQEELESACEEPLTAEELMFLFPSIKARRARNSNWFIVSGSHRCPICQLAYEIDPQINYRGAAFSALHELCVDVDNSAVSTIMSMADKKTNSTELLSYYPRRKR